VDHDILAADDGEGFAGVHQIGLHVVGAAVAALIDRRGEIGAGDFVAGLDEIVDRGGADLAAGARYEDAHPRPCTRCERLGA
jgi:hypothetical protein